MRAYYNKHKGSTANTEDLRRALEKASGVELGPFFKSWIYGGGHPNYEFSWEWDQDKRVVRLKLHQVQAETFFPNPVPIQIVTARGKRRLLLVPNGKELVKEIPFRQRPIRVDLDPDNQLLKEVSALPFTK